MKQIHFDMSYDKKLIFLSKKLTLNINHKEKMISLDKTKLHLVSLKSKNMKTSALLKKLRKVLKLQSTTYHFSSKIVKKLRDSYFKSKKIIQSKNLANLEEVISNKKQDCERLEKMWNPLIEKADKINDELNKSMEKIKNNQQNGDPKQKEFNLEREYKKLILSKQSLLLKAQGKRKTLSACEKSVKDLNFKIMRLRYSSYNNILMKKSQKHISYLYKRIYWRFRNPIRYILSKPNWKKIDLVSAMMNILHIKNKSTCLKGVLLWEEVGREVHKERDNDWKTYFNKLIKGRQIKIFNNQNNKYRRFRSLKKSRHLLFIKLREIEPKRKTKSSTKKLVSKKKHFEEKMGKNILASDKIRERYEKLLTSSKKKIKFIKTKLVKNVIKDAIHRRLFQLNLIKNRMKKKIYSLKGKFYKNHKGFLKLRSKYMSQVRYCILKKNIAKKKCDDTFLKKKLDKLANSKDVKNNEKWDVQSKIFQINKDIIEQNKVTDLMKTENFEEDEVKKFFNDLIENFFLEKTEHLPLNFIRDIQRLFLTQNFIKNLSQNVAKKKQTYILNKLTKDVESKMKNISLIRKLVEIEQTSKVSQNSGKNSKKTDNKSPKSKYNMKRLELLEKLNKEKVTLQNQKYAMIKKIEMAPLDDKNMGIKVDKLVKNAAYDTKRKLVRFDKKKKYLLLQFSKRQEEYNRAKLKLKNAKTDELREILNKIIHRKQIKLKEAFTDLHSMEKRYDILKRRINLLVNGELARKVLESNEKWMAKLSVMQKRIEKFDKNIEKEKKVLDLRSQNYARYTNEQIMKKYSNKNEKVQKQVATTANKKKTKIMNKLILSSIEKIKIMKARLIDLLNQKKYYVNLFNKESEKLINVIKSKYHLDIKEEINNRKKCMLNVSKLIAKDMKAKTKNVHN